jgi:hypothetical protein
MSASGEFRRGALYGVNVGLHIGITSLRQSIYLPSMSLPSNQYGTRSNLADGTYIVELPAQMDEGVPSRATSLNLWLFSRTVLDLFPGYPPGVTLVLLREF